MHHAGLMKGTNGFLFINECQYYNILYETNILERHNEHIQHRMEYYYQQKTRSKQEIY